MAAGIASTMAGKPSALRSSATIWAARLCLRSRLSAPDGLAIVATAPRRMASVRSVESVLPTSVDRMTTLHRERSPFFPGDEERRAFVMFDRKGGVGDEVGKDQVTAFLKMPADVGE